MTSLAGHVSALGLEVFLLLASTVSVTSPPRCVVRSLYSFYGLIFPGSTACDHPALVRCGGNVNDDTSASSSSDSLSGSSQYIEDLNNELDDLLARLYLPTGDDHGTM